MENKEYFVLEVMYKNIFKDLKDIFPIEWYYVNEYELKIKILKECIENKLLIIDSSLYYEFRLIALNS